MIHEMEPAIESTIGVGPCLIFVDFSVLQLGFALFLKRDDNQGHENVHKEEWEHDEEHYVKKRHLDAEERDWTPILVGGSHGVL